MFGPHDSIGLIGLLRARVCGVKFHMGGYLGVVYLFVILSLACVCPQPEILWNRTCGGSKNDLGWSIIPSLDGFLVVGRTVSYGSGKEDLYLIKLDAEGRMVWNRSYGGAEMDVGHGIAARDGGFILVGYSYSYGTGGAPTAYVVRTDPEGRMLWNRTCGGPHAVAHAVEGDEGGCVVAGVTYSFGAGSADAYVFRIDDQGTLVWNRTFGGRGSDVTYDIVACSGGGFALTGSTLSFGAGNGDMYLVRIDAEGRLMWNKSYGGSLADEAWKLAEAVDGGYLLVGRRQVNSDRWNLYAVKVDKDGTMAWDFAYGAQSDSYGTDCLALDDGGFLVVGYAYSAGSSESDVVLLRLGPSGSLVWDTVMLDAGSEVVRSVARGGDREYLMVGAKTSRAGEGNDVYVLQVRDDAVLPVVESHSLGAVALFLLGFGVLFDVRAHERCGGRKLAGSANGNSVHRPFRGS